MFSVLGLTLLLLSSFALAADLYKVLDCMSQPVSCTVPNNVSIVHKSASDKDIRHAYKKLSRKFHPDKNKDPDAEDRFVEIAHGASLVSEQAFHVFNALSG